MKLHLPSLLRLFKRNPRDVSGALTYFLEEETKAQMKAKRLKSIQVGQGGGLRIDPNVPSYVSKEEGEKALQKLKLK